VQHLRVGFARACASTRSRTQRPLTKSTAPRPAPAEILRTEYAQRAGLRLDRQRGVDEFAAQERSHALTQGLTAQMPAGAAMWLEA